VCLLDFACERYKPTDADVASKSSNRTNLSFPRKPQVLQIWHAFGAYKKFGFQSVDTPEGHSSDFTDAYDIHRNYSWVLCSGSAARPAFAEAFSCPESRVVALPRPEYDELVEAREKRALQRLGRTGSSEATKLSALMAPTLRINTESSHPFKDLFSRRGSFEADIDMDFTWSFHPLEQGLPAPGNVSDRLLEADCVVTDYSSIVYEAFVLRVPAFFYIPDIEEYRSSPRLNADPALLCPEICAFDEGELALKLKRFAEDPDSYSWESLDAFGASGFDPDVDGLPGTAASRIVDFALRQLEGDES
jgi:CDP-glycerol glycerophosphotransferase (TagB/SpsB family)